MTRRFAIYVYWDAEGILKEFARNFLVHLCENSQDVLVVVNGELTEESCTFIETIGCKYIKRLNRGYDFGAYQAGLLYVGWTQLRNYDELVLCNSSFYGPFCPLHMVFDAADKGVDFWGITAWIGGPWPDHIQSYFYVFRDRMFNSEEFRRYWTELQWPKDRTEAIEKCETQLTKMFASQGFTWDTLIPNDTNCDISILYAKESLSRGMPFLKRKYFDQISVDGTDKIWVLTFLQHRYDLNLIFEDVFYKYCTVIDRVRKRSLKEKIKRKIPTRILTFYRELQYWLVRR